MRIVRPRIKQEEAFSNNVPIPMTPSVVEHSDDFQVKAISGNMLSTDKETRTLVDSVTQMVWTASIQAGSRYDDDLRKRTFMHSSLTQMEKRAEEERLQCWTTERRGQGLVVECILLTLSQ